MAGRQQDDAVETDNEDGDGTRGEKGWQSISAPTAHCTALQAYRHALGARWVLRAWVLGFLGTAWIFRGGRWRWQTCADPETQELGSKRRKRGMEGRESALLQFAGVEAPPGSQACSKGGRSEPLGWDFELSNLETLIGGGGTRTVWRLFFVPRRGSSLDWNATQALGEGTVGTPLLVSLCCLGPRLPSLLPGSFNPRDPCASLPCLPRLLHRSRFPTAHHLHLAFRQLGRALHWATGRV